MKTKDSVDMRTFFSAVFILIIIGNVTSSNADEDEEFHEHMNRFLDQSGLKKFEETISYFSMKLYQSEIDPLEYQPEKIELVAQIAPQHEIDAFILLLNEYRKWNPDFDWLMREWSEFMVIMREKYEKIDFSSVKFIPKFNKLVKNFWIQCIKKSFDSGLPHSVKLFSDLNQGSGLCTYFQHPLFTNLETSLARQSALQDFLYFFNYYHSGFQGKNEELKSLEFLGEMCISLRRYPYNDEQKVREMVLGSFSNDKLSIDVLPSSAHSSEENVSSEMLCKMFFRKDFVDRFIRRFPKPEIQLLALDSCIEEIYITILNAFKTPKIQRHNVWVFRRWFIRLFEYASRRFELNLNMAAYLEYLDVQRNKEFALYLKALVDEIPIPDAYLAYKHGTGYLCELFDEEPFSGIHAAQTVLKIYYDRGSKLIARGTLKHEFVTYFALLYATCKNLKSRSELDNL